MIAIVAWLALSAQATAPSPAPEPVVAPDAEAPAIEPAVQPWDGSYAAGLAQVRTLAESGATTEAIAVAERLAVPNALVRRLEALRAAQGWRARVGRTLESLGDALDLLGPPPAIRAEASFARGVALTLGAERTAVEEERPLLREGAHLAFESARLLAGPGELRRDATYDQGLLAFAAGEAERVKLPEISGQQPAPPPASVPGVPPAAAPPDPLQLARAAYVAARERFVERLRLDWRDADTQACTELVQRRLRELDEIEKKREQDKQDEQQKQDEQKQKDQQDQQKDPKADDKKDEQKPDDPKKQDPSEDPKQDPQKEPPKDEPKPDEPKPDETQKPDAKPLDPKDLPAMSKEEMLQLLERLEKIAEAQKDLEQKLKRMRKVSVDKDW